MDRLKHSAACLDRMSAHLTPGCDRCDALKANPKHKRANRSDYDKQVLRYIKRDARKAKARAQQQEAKA